MKTKPFFITDLDYKLLQEKYSEKELQLVLSKINSGYPVQYAIGNVQFLNSKIFVDERVLIPRFETELLVYKTLNYLKNRDNLKILDLCSGSGCIAINLKMELKRAHVDACDISEGALSLAKTNAKYNNTRINFFKKNIIRDFEFNKRYEVIISNPPYVATDDKVDIQTRFEPKSALYPGKDELIFYKTILKNAKRIINKNAIIAFEIGSKQAKRIHDIIKEYFPNSKVLIEKDYNNFDRFIFIFTE